ncbi:hypothetical protein GCM10011404_08470 [Sphingomonas prati]|uniref:Uncharacterized protein (TIGR02001 family) n=1 Tax=Sphingomonas prati TaxID=1843237 RepID=A0A7W9BST1_9SPHN|nr:uncharacterized protein (TIGR02001 family) [Sphingomonas prati]GGE78127.1 hypothetical protein GCM10011404_08470 [Sphingomonas prati]
MTFSKSLIAVAFITIPAIAQAQSGEPVAAIPSIVVTGSAGLVSDYRFHGVSQSDRDMAVQAGLTITHQSGLYVGTWGPTSPAGARSVARTWNST